MEPAMILPRRKFLTGLAASFLAAPAIVRASSLMAISPVPPLVKPYQIVNVALWSHAIARDLKADFGNIRPFQAAEDIFTGQLVWLDKTGTARPAHAYTFTQRMEGHLIGLAVSPTIQTEIA